MRWTEGRLSRGFWSVTRYRDIRDVLLSRDSGVLINETRLAQPALFVTEYALAKLWGSWGLQPAAMLGHSIGELVAALRQERNDMLPTIRANSPGNPDFDPTMFRH